MKAIVLLLAFAALAAARPDKREVRVNEHGVKYFYDPETGQSFYTGLILPETKTKETKEYFTGLKIPDDYVPPPFYDGEELSGARRDKREVRVDEHGVTYFYNPETGQSYYTGLIVPEAETKEYYTGLIIPDDYVPPPFYDEKEPSPVSNLFDAAGNIVEHVGDTASSIVNLPFSAAHEVISGVGLEETGVGELGNTVLDVGEAVLQAPVSLAENILKSPFRIASKLTAEEEKKDKRSVQSVAAQCCANAGMVSVIQNELGQLRAAINRFDQGMNSLVAKLSKL